MMDLLVAGTMTGRDETGIALTLIASEKIGGRTSLGLVEDVTAVNVKYLTYLGN